MLRSWNQLLGHAEQRSLFRRSIVQGRLSHAYLLTGPPGIGKLLFARLLAMSVFCREAQPDSVDVCGECRACRSFLAGTWPDYTEIGRPAGKSAIPISSIVGEQGERGRSGLCYTLSMAPQASDRRVAVINDAADMTQESANALLKTLEEPPADSLILLVCDNADNLLPTIRSRCQVVRFFPLNVSDVRDILLREQLAESEDDAMAVAELSDGSLETAVQLLNPELRKLKVTVSRGIAQLEQMQPLILAAETIGILEQVSGNTSEQRQNCQWVLRFISDAIRGRLRSLAGGDMSDPLTQRLGARSGVDLLGPLLDRTLEASRQVDGSSPVKLVVEALFDDLARMCRQAIARR